MSQKKGPAKLSKGTMTDISMIQKLTRPAQLKPSGPPRRRPSFADQDKRRQSDLTDQDVKLTRRVWAEHVEPNKEELLNMVFNELFAKYPEMADLFTRMENAGLPKLIIPDDPPFKSYHLGRVMVRLRQMLEYMNNPERLTKLMTKLGVLHAKMDLEGACLDDFQSEMVATIKLAMNNQMHPSEETALRKCFEMAFSIMEEASYTYYDLFVATTALKKIK